MAIPLYVPEEYGPVSHSSATTTTSLLPPPANCASFVHQLILELYSIYHEYCAASASVSANNGNGHGAEPTSDINNNSMQFGTLHPRRRRHPAGSHGVQSQHHDMVPLPAALMPTVQSPAPDDLNPVNHQRSELECKLSLETNFCSIGFQLRQIADSYAAKANPVHYPCNSSCSQEDACESKFGTTSSYKTTWHGTFAFVGSLLFLSFSATFVFIKSK